MSTRGIQPRATGRQRRARIRPGPRRCASSRRAGCTFFGPSATTGSAAVRSPVGKVASSLGRRSYSPLVRTRCGTEDACRASTASDRRRTYNLGGLLAVRRNRVSCTGRYVRWRAGSVASRSVLHPTRLETRTKESNMCASHGVLRNPKAQ
jgi:hypothetical protein